MKEMAQLAPEATMVPQVLAVAKSAAFAPLVWTEFMVRSAVPRFVRVTVWSPLVVPMF